MDKEKNESLVSDHSLEQLRRSQGTVDLQYCENGLDKYVMTHEEYIKKNKRDFKYNSEDKPIRESAEITTPNYTIMYDFDVTGWEKVLNKIDKADLYEGQYFGLEKKPHMTILYGLTKDVPMEEYVETCSMVKAPVEVSFESISKFESKEYDVLIFKCNVDKQTLILNDILNKYENLNTFDFTPHCTICYLKKGKIDKYLKTIDTTDLELDVTRVIISDEDRNETYVDIK